MWRSWVETSREEISAIGHPTASMDSLQFYDELLEPLTGEHALEVRRDI
jgi:hypothetical protein